MSPAGGTSAGAEALWRHYYFFHPISSPNALAGALAVVERTMDSTPASLL